MKNEIVEELVLEVANKNKIALEVLRDIKNFIVSHASNCNVLERVYLEAKKKEKELTEQRKEKTAPYKSEVKKIEDIYREPIKIWVEIATVARTKVNVFRAQEEEERKKKFLEAQKIAEQAQKEEKKEEKEKQFEQARSLAIQSSAQTTISAGATYRKVLRARVVDYMHFYNWMASHQDEAKKLAPVHTPALEFYVKTNTPPPGVKVYEEDILVKGRG